MEDKKETPPPMASKDGAEFIRKRSGKTAKDLFEQTGVLIPFALLFANERIAPISFRGLCENDGWQEVALVVISNAARDSKAVAAAFFSEAWLTVGAMENEVPITETIEVAMMTFEHVETGSDTWVAPIETVDGKRAIGEFRTTRTFLMEGEDDDFGARDVEVSGRMIQLLPVECYGRMVGEA